MVLAAAHDTPAGDGVEQTLSGPERVGYAVPMLVAAFIAAQAAAASISLTTDEPLYELLLHWMILLGFLCSLLAVRFRLSFTLVGSLVMVGAFIAYALRNAVNMPIISLFYPPEVMSGDETVLAAFIGWFLVGFCFMQSQRQNLIFIFVPGLTTLGLMATVNLNPELMVSFLVFLLASVYCWGYDHFLRMAERTNRKLNWRRWARVHMSGAALVFAIAIIGGVVLGNGLFYTSPRLYSGWGLQNRIWNYAGAHVQGYFLFRQGFQIGTGPIVLSPTEVLKVKADEAQLWRGRAYDYYDGGGWSRSNPTQRRVMRAGEREFNLRKLAPRIRYDGQVSGFGYGVPSGEPGSYPSPALPQGFDPGTAGGPPEAAAAPQAPPGGPPEAAAAPQVQRGGPPSMSPEGQMANPGPLSQMPDAQQGASDQAAATIDWKPERIKGREFIADFEVLGNSTSGLFTTSHGYKMRFGPASGQIDPGRGQVSADSYGSYMTSTVMSVGQRYTVWSRLPEFSAEELRDAGEGDYSADFRERYIEANAITIATELGPLVKQITKGAGNDYDKALAIQRYLEKNCLYTLNVPPTPVGKDPVVYFVTRSRRGACDLFASAMTLMCRLADVPARVATGFNRGEYDRGQDAFIVRGTEAHAWSELHFPGYGWVPFDLVAVQSLEGQSWTSLFRLGQWQVVTRRISGVAFRLTLVILVLYLVTNALVDPRRYINPIARRWRHRTQPPRLMAMEYVGLMRLLARRAHVRYRSAMTPREFIDSLFAAALLRANPELDETLASITERFYALRYGHEASPDQVEKLRRDIKQVRRSVRRARAHHRSSKDN